MTGRTIKLKTAATAVFFAVAALLIASWLQVFLQQHGIAKTLASDLSSLLAIGILILTLAPLWRDFGPVLTEQLRKSPPGSGLIIKAITIGVLMRAIWWAHIVIATSLGWYSSDVAVMQSGPSYAFACDRMTTMLIGIGVMGVLVPITEEIVHRGIFQSAAMKFGAPIAIGSSAALFAILHTADQWLVAFAAGVVLGYLYWATRALWASLMAHATYNGLTLLDWRCLSIQWNPPSVSLPLTTTAAISIALFLVFIALLVAILKGLIIETSDASR